MGRFNATVLGWAIGLGLLAGAWAFGPTGEATAEWGDEPAAESKDKGHWEKHDKGEGHKDKGEGRAEKKWKDREKDKESGWSAEGDRKKKEKPARVEGAYRALDLTPDQAERIAGIQRETAERIKALKEREREQVLAVLSPAQREKLEDKASAKKQQYRVWGMKGHLKRLENKRDALKAKREKVSGDWVEKYDAQIKALDEKIEAYKAEIEQEALKIDKGDADDRGKKDHHEKGHDKKSHDKKGHDEKKHHDKKGHDDKKDHDGAGMGDGGW